MRNRYPEAEHGIVNRVQGSVFGYQGWGTVARDEEGTLYTVASGFRVSHICPFGKTVMYISRNNGRTWSPPIVINDTYMDDRDAGILYMGNGRMLVTWFFFFLSIFCFMTAYPSTLSTGLPLVLRKVFDATVLPLYRMDCMEKTPFKKPL